MLCACRGFGRHPGTVYSCPQRGVPIKEEEQFTICKNDTSKKQTKVKLVKTLLQQNTEKLCRNMDSFVSIDIFQNFVSSAFNLNP